MAHRNRPKLCSNRHCFHWTWFNHAITKYVEVFFQLYNTNIQWLENLLLFYWITLKLIYTLFFKPNFTYFALLHSFWNWQFSRKYFENTKHKKFFFQGENSPTPWQPMLMFAGKVLPTSHIDQERKLWWLCALTL